ncbi:MAG TPA: KaiC domain-containing protein [Methanomicrobiales archaeon]|nr:KaiC domain-containing protein [Methanomicrobiales archaeon]
MNPNGRVSLGIEGLDGMLDGGLINPSICAIIGSYGTGKTTLSLQFITEGLSKREKCIYISLDERVNMLQEIMKQRGRDVTPFMNKSLFLMKLDPTNFNLMINSIKEELFELIEKTGATRVVIDPMSLFEGTFQNSADRRLELIRFIEMMRDQPCTLLITSETESGNPLMSRYGLIEYLVDTVILLRYYRPSDLTPVHLAVEVVKMRQSRHSREIKPFEILQDQILVHSGANVF